MFIHGRMRITSSDHTISLRTLEPGDVQNVVSLANNPKIAANLRDAFPHPYTEKDAEAFIEAARSANPPFRFAIEKDGHYVGNIALHVQDDVYQKSAEIGYFVGEPYWGQGIGTEAVKLIVDYGFTTLGVQRIFAGVFSTNPASARLLEKAGFSFEGASKNAVFKNGVLCDELRYAILKA